MATAIFGFDTRETVMDPTWIEGDTTVPWFLHEGRPISHPMLSPHGSTPVPPEFYDFRGFQFMGKKVWVKELDATHEILLSITDQGLLRICFYDLDTGFECTVQTPVDHCHFTRCG